MRWQDYRQSDSFEDRRGGSGGGGFNFPTGGGKGLGLGGLVIVGILALVFGVDPRILLQGMDMINGGGGGGYEQQSSAPARPAGPSSDEQARFVRAVLATTEDVWGPIFQASGRKYDNPTLVLYDGRGTQTACGFGQPAMGPFYCPGDQKIYLDTSFFSELKDRFGAPGDFAAAYVIAHEVGHHVQKELGTLQRTDAARARAPEREANQISVRTELQADCYAGVFAFHAGDRLKVLQQGDIEEGLKAAAAVGDDNIQRRSQGRVVPESFTHGSSADRMAWFKRGLAAGKPQDCNTFAS
jgi:predicted metalloprotease